MVHDVAGRPRWTWGKIAVFTDVKNVPWFRHQGRTWECAIIGAQIPFLAIGDHVCKATFRSRIQNAILAFDAAWPVLE